MVRATTGETRWAAGGARLRLVWLVAAVAGAMFLVVIAVDSWPRVYFDGLAYWRAGERLVSGGSVYQPGLVGTPLAYWYPPPLAQALAPLTAVIPEAVFNWVWIAALVACLWWLMDGSPIRALASLAFLPVAVELNIRNIHLLLAVMLVIGLTKSGWSWLLGVGAAIKLAPGIGIVYLAARGRWRDATIGLVTGAVICGVSFVLAPSLWFDWVSTMLSNGGVSAGAALLPIPYWARALAGLLLAVWAGRQPTRIGDPLAVVAVVLALPTWWAPAFATLLAAWKLRPRLPTVRRV
jgi:alpha-1,2-mannosyltransferase